MIESRPQSNMMCFDIQEELIRFRMDPVRDNHCQDARRVEHSWNGIDWGLLSEKDLLFDLPCGKKIQFITGQGV